MEVGPRSVPAAAAEPRGKPVIEIGNLDVRVPYKTVLRRMAQYQKFGLTALVRKKRRSW